MLVETVLEKADIPGGKVLDLGTGAGCILISLMALGSYGRGVGADISEDALRVARMNGIFNRENWEKNGRGANDILWLQSNLFEKVSGRFDAVSYTHLDVYKRQLRCRYGDTRPQALLLRN